MKQVSITKAVKIKNQRVKPFNGEKEYLATGGLIGDKVITEKVTYKTKPSRADLLVTENQLIVARMKETNKVLLIDENTSDLIVSTGFLVLDVQEGWHPGFLFHYFVSSFFQKQKDKLSIGATQKAINNEKFKEILIPEISFVDQKRIVKILDEADALRQKRKQVIGLLDDYLKSVFLEMFGDPVTNEKGWEKIPFNDLCLKLSDGPFGSKLKTEHYSESGIRVIRLQNIGVGKFKDANKSYIKKDYYKKELRKYTCHPGDIVIATLGDPNIRACIVPSSVEKAVHKADCVHCLPKEVLNKEFLVNLLNLPEFHHFFGEYVHGQTRSRISSGQLKRVMIPVPPIELQNKFAELFQKTESLKQSMLAQSAELETQFQALMQKAFKGEL